LSCEHGGVHRQDAAHFRWKPHLYEGRYCGLLLVCRRAGDVQLQQLLQVVAVARDCVSSIAVIADVLEDVHLCTQSHDAHANLRVGDSLGSSVRCEGVMQKGGRGGGGGWGVDCGG
jgi:hypothetical protein